MKKKKTVRKFFKQRLVFLLSKKIEMFSVSIYTKRSQTKISSSKKKIKKKIQKKTKLSDKRIEQKIQFSKRNKHSRILRRFFLILVDALSLNRACTDFAFEAKSIYN